MKTSGAGKAERFTSGQRFAIGENIRLFVLLTDATTPLAKELAMIVLTRIKAINDGCDVEPPTDEVLLTMLRLALDNASETAKQETPDGVDQTRSSHVDLIRDKPSMDLRQRSTQAEKKKTPPLAKKGIA